MEHLHYFPSEEQMTREWEDLEAANFRVEDWDEWDKAHGPCPQVEELTPWLGFDHDSVTSKDLSFLAEYGDSQVYAILWEEGAGYRSLETLAKKATQQAAQCFFYVGLLECFLSRSIGLSLLTRKHPTAGLVLYSRCLTSLVRGRISEVQAMDEDGQFEMLGQWKADISLASMSLNTMHRIYQEVPQGDKFPDTFRAVYCLIAALEYVIGIINRTPQQQSYPTLITSPVIERLRQKFWCPALLRQYIPLLSTLQWLEGSGISKPEESHDACVGLRTCAMNNIDVSTYFVKHVDDTCSCEFITVSYNDIKATLERDMVPLVQLKDHSDLSTMEVVGAGDEYKAEYVAISHVWSHGLGSDSEHGLPVCQVRRIAYLAQHAIRQHSSKTLRFWIDSLCIPAETKLRKKAISLMRKTYSSATYVLVIDKLIMRCDYLNWLGLAGAIIFSDWRQRLWTYQESCLASTLVFATANALVDARALLREVRRHEIYSVMSRMFSYLLEFVKPMDTDFHHTAINFEQVAQAISFRTTSKLEDEAIVIGSLLGSDLQAITELEGDKRMMNIYQHLDIISWHIIFDQGPRMETFPFRWAPNTLLTGLPRSRGKFDGAEVTEKGLAIHPELMILRLKKPLRMPDISMLDFRTGDTLQKRTSLCYIYDSTLGIWYTLSLKLEEKEFEQLSNPDAKLPPQTFVTEFRPTFIRNPDSSMSTKNVPDHRMDFIIMQFPEPNSDPDDVISPHLAGFELLARGGTIISETSDGITCSLCYPSYATSIRRHAGDSKPKERPRPKTCSTVHGHWESKTVIVT